MASICDRADDAMSKLRLQCQEILPSWLRIYDPVEKAVYTLLDRIERFTNEFRCLRIFMDCIHKWTDLEDVLHLGSLVRKVEATIQEIANKLIENIVPLKRPLSDSPIHRILWKIEDRFLRQKVSKLDDLFSGLMCEVLDLKPKIRKAYDCLTNHSFQIRFNFDDRKEFKKFVDNYQQACSSQARYSNSPLEKEFRYLNHNLHWATYLLSKIVSENVMETEDAMIHVGRVAISAALRLCEWWAGQMDLNRKEIIRIVLLELQQKMDLVIPEFIDKAQWVRRNSFGRERYEFSHQMRAFFRFYPFEDIFERYRLDLVQPYILADEMESLLLSVPVIQIGNEEIEPWLWAEVKVVLTELVLQCRSCGSRADAQTILEYLLLQIMFIKIEIVIRKELYYIGIQELNYIGMPMKWQIDALNHGFIFLKREWQKFQEILIRHSPQGNTEKMKLILMLMEELDKVVAFLDHSICAEEITITKKMASNATFKLLLMIVLSKALFMTLQNNNKSLMVFDQKQIEALHQGLEIFIMFVKDQPEDNVKEAKLKFANIEEVACGVTSLRNSLSTEDISEEAIMNMNLFVSNLLKKVRGIMVDLKVNYLHAPTFNFPKTNALGFIDSLLEKLRELLKADLTESMKHQIEEILGDLQFLTPSLGDILEQDVEPQELKDLGAPIVDVAYEAECCIDLMMLEDSVEWHYSLWLYLLVEDIRSLKTRVSKICNKTNHSKVQNVPQTSMRATNPRIEEAFVVLIDQEEMIIDRLIGRTRQLEIVSVVGMPGIGKTTLAKQVFNSPHVVSHFHIRTWCCISEIYRKREVLLEILSHITALTDDMIGMPDEDLEFKLYQLLKEERYLIVMDDMWDTKALDDLRSTLPNDGNGSRILITSRHHHVALKANPFTDPHLLRELSATESWNLLQMKIFHEELCPKELSDIGEQIAKSCKGLPLAIVAAAGLLEKTNRQLNSWKKIGEVLTSRIVDDPQDQCRRILELSYKHLPDYLKACFLYFGAFPEDQDIPSRKVMQLWIAEGFVQKTEFKSLEDLAEDYLMDLIGRSLVIFSQRRSRRGAKSCRLHDVLRKFCQSKAKEDKFLMFITGSSESNASPHDLGYAVNANFSNPSSPIACEDHRLSFCKQFIESRPSGPYVRSLLCFATNDKDPRRPYDISFISDNFRLLKVLDLECINIGTSIPSGIVLLVHLRYLAVAGYIDSVPSSIANLWNLETFVVMGLKGKANLPNSIWSLKRLRHIHVSDLAVISMQDEQHGNSSPLDCLVTLSSPFLHFGEDTDNILRQFRNLRKLKCIFSKSWDNSKKCNQFPSLGVLTKLESLKISYCGQVLHPGEFSFPSNLKKLTLSDFHLPWDMISVIGRLPNLEVLKLLSRAFDGENWDMVEGEFSVLKYLKLDTLNIAKWKACGDHLPKLEQLVLRCCRNLEELPVYIAEVPTLQMIDVQWCGDLVEKSARQIREEGDEKLKVFINFAELDFSST